MWSLESLPMIEDGNKTKEQLIREMDELRSWRRKQEALEEKRKKIDETVQKAFDDLEILTGERTAILQKANEKLMREIQERERVEEALRESETQLRLLSSQLFNAQEKERQRLSKELHDQLGHDLVLLKSRLRAIGRKLPREQTTLHGDFDETSRYVEQIIENVRRIAADLSPSILEDLGLFASLRWLVENFSKQHAINVDLDMDDVDHYFSQETRVNLFRVFQETLTNISKHARAKTVSIVVKRKKDAVYFRVTDDGRGFNPGRSPERDPALKGMGLAAMKERVHLSGGTFEVRTQPGKGTSIRFDIPTAIPRGGGQ
jgi:signal transduction histidine kinase